MIFLSLLYNYFRILFRLKKMKHIKGRLTSSTSNVWFGISHFINYWRPSDPSLELDSGSCVVMKLSDIFSPLSSFCLLTTKNSKTDVTHCNRVLIFFQVYYGAYPWVWGLVSLPYLSCPGHEALRSGDQIPAPIGGSITSDCRRRKKGRFRCSQRGIAQGIRPSWA